MDDDCLAFIIVRIGRRAARRGFQRLARLTAKYGPEIASGAQQARQSICGVYLPDLKQPHPSDAPSGLLKLWPVKG
jgi:hypothetical protein